MTLSFALPKFSGSTLQPSTEPIMLYEPHYYEKNAGRAMHIRLTPTRPTPPLKRKCKPPHIVIPEPDFDDIMNHLNNEEFSPWSPFDTGKEESKSTATTNSTLWDSSSS
ncbi:MAG: hypothetical protein EXX96DRAFT_488115 [Benjaminiella poitrasii]|nr:MAG: hypothetical protein EXX96DRAFT_488115 [Benjaminiella poitrasii]